MSAFDTAKEIVRIGSTAGLSKDVVDLLEKKVALLTGELSDSHQKTARLEARILELEAEVSNLRGHPQNPLPVGFEESMGVLWKRTPTGYETHPYCAECPRPAIMSPMHRARLFVCSNGHDAPLSVKPPSA